jgi:hypothetical protein
MLSTVVEGAEIVRNESVAAPLPELRNTPMLYCRQKRKQMDYWKNWKIKSSRGATVLLCRRSDAGATP